MDKLQQLNISYNPIEDRLLLRISVQSEEKMLEYKIWLTRRFVRILNQALGKIIDSLVAEESGISATGREAMRELRQEEALSRSDFTTPYHTETLHNPLGPEPLLASRYVVKNRDNNTHVLTFITPDNTGIHITLDRSLTFSLQKLLFDSIKKTNWNIDSKFNSEGFTLQSTDKIKIQ